VTGRRVKGDEESQNGGDIKIIVSALKISVH